MKGWRRNKKTNRELPSFLRVGLTRLNQGLIAMAGFLQRRTSRYSGRKKKMLLLLFVIAFLTESVVVTIRGFKGGQRKTLTLTRIRTIPLQEDQPRALPLSTSDFLKIQRFRTYLDDLGTTAKGRKTRDSLLRGRPHLVDSLNFLINLFFEQSKANRNEK